LFCYDEEEVLYEKAFTSLCLNFSFYKYNGDVSDDRTG
jgi:hypothetical protein